MADPFARAVDSAFRRLGIAAVLDPDGVARAVTLLPSQEDRVAEFAEVGIREPGEVYEIRAGEFDGFTKGAVLAIGDRRRRVKRTRVRDPRRLKVELETVAV